MADTKFSFPNGQYRKQSSADAHDEDESLLRQPLRSSCGGFREAKKAYENGTDEVRRLLMQECSLIYECKVCRNMFRSFANFISHKRNYCKSTSDSCHSFPDRNSSMLIQSVERPESSSVKSLSTGSSPIPTIKCSNRDLSKVIERLKRVEVSSDCSLNKKLAVECKEKVLSPEPKPPDPVLELESVSTTRHAVYQTLKTKNYADSIKTELEEVHNLLENQKIMLGSDGKAITGPGLISFTSTTENEGKRLENNYEAIQLSQGISCEICKMQFQTEKTLKIHTEKNHTATTYVFQCPTCSMTFLQPAAVIRHLANEHKKPLRRIRKMRDTILKKRIQIGDVQVKGLGREVKRLHISNTKDLDGSYMVDQQNGRSITSCTFCLKNFDRRAALASHLPNCFSRKNSFNNSEFSKKISGVSNDENTKNKIENHLLEQINQNDKTINGERAAVKVNIKQEPQEDLSSTSSCSNINKLFENLENQTFGNGLHTVCLETIQMMVESKENSVEMTEKTDHMSSKNKDCCGDPNNEKKIKEDDKVSGNISVKKEKTKRFRKVPASKQLTCRCKICNKQFNAISNLRRHISMFHYRSRRFGCSLCEYRAFRRYDIVNHLTFVHKISGERESIAVEYVTVHEIKYSKDDVDGDIVVVNDEAILSDQYKTVEQQQIGTESQTLVTEISSKPYKMEEKSKKVLLRISKDTLQPLKIDSSIAPKDKSHVKVVRRKLKKSLEQGEDKKRPIRNRIKTVNNDFVYDLLTVKEEPKQLTRVALKRRSTVFVDQNNVRNIKFSPPPIKITPYRLRTEPLMPADKKTVKGVAENIYRNVIHEGLAAPSTLPHLPTERPQMRSRLISSSRSDLNTVSIIETSELEAAGLKSTFFDDSFLEKFAKKSNPSFKMKPLLALQHSPLNSILQKFDASQQNNINRIENQKHPESDNNSPPNYTICLLQSLTQPSLQEKEITPNGKQILDPPSPPATPKKRITLMQRLAENRAKRGDSLIRTALEN